MPCVCSRRAASIASSIRSPGMNRDTERITNGVLVARSRSQAMPDAPSSSLRMMLTTGAPSHASDQAAVDLHRRPGHIGRGVRQQERRHAAEFVGLAVATHWNRRGGALALLLGGNASFPGVDLVDLPDPIRADPAWNELVDADVA